MKKNNRLFTSFIVRKAGGFSLVELLIVLAMLMILASLGIGQLRIFNGMTIRNELSQLYSVAFYLQKVAQSSGSLQYLTIDTATHSYRYKNTTHRLPAGISFGVMPGIWGPPAAPTHEITVPHTFKGDTIQFYPDGTIQAGTLYITDGKRHCYALTCGVSAISFLRKYRYADGAWHHIP